MASTGTREVACEHLVPSRSRPSLLTDTEKRHIVSLYPLSQIVVSSLHHALSFWPACSRFQVKSPAFGCCALPGISFSARHRPRLVVEMLLVWSCKLVWLHASSASERQPPTTAAGHTPLSSFDLQILCASRSLFFPLHEFPRRSRLWFPCGAIPHPLTRSVRPKPPPVPCHWSLRSLCQSIIHPCRL